MSGVILSLTSKSESFNIEIRLATPPRDRTAAFVRQRGARNSLKVGYLNKAKKVDDTHNVHCYAICTRKSNMLHIAIGDSLRKG